MLRRVPSSLATCYAFGLRVELIIARLELGALATVATVVRTPGFPKFGGIEGRGTTLSAFFINGLLVLNCARVKVPLFIL